MKKVSVLLSFVFCCVFAYAQDQSIGLRAGDPTGVTYKKYIGKKNGVEFILGTAAPGWSHTYYHNTFNAVDDFNGSRYWAHRVNSVVYLQGRYLIHNNIPVQGLEGNWDWYWGVGAVFKVASIRYTFENANGMMVNDTYADIDLGPDGIAGMEYTFEGVPITVFAELSLMLEIVDRVTVRPLSGIGARYRF